MARRESLLWCGIFFLLLPAVAGREKSEDSPFTSHLAGFHAANQSR